MALVVLGSLLVLGAAAWSVNIWVFDAHTSSGGHALLRQAEARHAAAVRSPATCTDPASGGAVGVLEAPSIGLVAPVEQGESDAVMAVAVGHDAASVWPGSVGTAVFGAHDVSYFVNAGQLQAGAVLRYETACTTYDFTVTGHKVVAAGSPVYNTPGPSLVLVTCWPTDALWFTPDRLVVTAVETSIMQTATTDRAHAATASASASAYRPPTVAAPAALSNEGLTLATNSIPMGTMTIAGSPAPAWTQSPDPLDVEQSAVEAYIGGVKALGAEELPWWRPLAPGTTPPPALLGATHITYRSGLDVAVSVAGTNPKGVVLTTAVTIEGGKAPGSYTERVEEAVRGGVLTILSWQLSAG